MKRLALYLIFLFTATIPALASTEPVLRLSLQECVDSAMANNGRISLARMEIEKATIMKGTAFNPSKTSVTLKQETTGGGGPDNGVAFGQEFEFPTVYIARNKVLTAEENLQRSAFDQASFDLENEVAKEYYTMLYQLEMLKLNSALADLYGIFHQLASKRFELGDCSALEVLNAQRMADLNHMEGEDIRRDLDQTTRRMMTLTGTQIPVMPADTILPRIIFVTDSCGFDYQTTVMARVADSEIELLNRNASLARQEMLPDISLGATVQALIKGFNPYHIERERFKQGNFMAFEIGISLPVFFGAQKSKIKAAETDISIARLRKETAASEAEKEYEALLSRLEKAVGRLAFYDENALSQAEEIKRLADVSYEYGEIDYMEYINNLQTYYSVKKEYVEAINEYNMTVLQLMVLTGKK